jgi:hypothetical protein
LYYFITLLIFVSIPWLSVDCCAPHQVRKSPTESHHQNFSTTSSPPIRPRRQTSHTITIAARPCDYSTSSLPIRPRRRPSRSTTSRLLSRYVRVGGPHARQAPPHVFSPDTSSTAALAHHGHRCTAVRIIHVVSLRHKRTERRCRVLKRRRRRFERRGSRCGWRSL